ncbi:MAG: hypothetical protein U9N30_02890 [Campylobacterota bacterium]|nr:hypothetical protein [Campylobacterota bacterium]
MLNNRAISELFEVQVNTLYNWQKTKPKLYKYLQNADYNSTRNEEINILLKEYTKEVNMNFTYGQIAYILRSDLKLLTMEDIKNFGKLFIKAENKNLISNTDMILDVYDKLKQMNIIEKYILYKKIYLFREEKIRSEDRVYEYFNEFLSQDICSL